MQMEEISLEKLSPGKTAKVTRIRAEEPLQSRLADLGLLPGARIEYLFPAPAGDPHAYRLRGATIALRNRDSAKILVRPEAEE